MIPLVSWVLLVATAQAVPTAPPPAIVYDPEKLAAAVQMVKDVSPMDDATFKAYALGTPDRYIAEVMHATKLDWRQRRYKELLAKVLAYYKKELSPLVVGKRAAFDLCRGKEMASMEISEIDAVSKFLLSESGRRFLSATLYRFRTRECLQEVFGADLVRLEHGAYALAGRKLPNRIYAPPPM
jgi:hypothetical protein